MLPTPIVSVSWLSENLNHSDLIILNATIPKATTTSLDNLESKQIIGARFFDIKNVFSDTISTLPNTFPTLEKFQIEARKLGINENSLIVAYDDHGIYSSARAWWLFRSFGHKNIAVLDGGLSEWIAAGLPLEKQKKQTNALGNFQAKYQKNSIKDYQEVLASIENENFQILDARSKERFCGSTPEPRIGLRSGHIPSSESLPYTDVLTEGRMKNNEALVDVFKEYQGKELIFSCGSGITACILALGAEIAGYKNSSVYDGSWTEWGSKEELPIEVCE